ncbi:SDR family oxidoreductase [Thiorhodovibrio frisius]|uniref:Nucleoside-diphosphate-sugar epimerase n=1 Tax=Thiorhodovibrio frisius TaxID=631362 RepID=H8YVM4_9GAMM|nr:SDR family oxidoreductase [Thiorhodovibrio frisius]EIC23964.1 nucleoside-diphosphate-sugar epimerase [Thiorhodovibrio frisius]WPL23037.1 NAD dependent epimerase/dehydratase family protein [Thiorhodovibrio frisius]
MKRQIIIGCGYVGQLLLRRLGEQCAQPPIGVARQDATLTAIASAGGEPMQLDLDRDPLDALPSDRALVFHFAPPPSEGAQDSRTARLIEHFGRHGHPGRLIYISTTGVYGDCAGAWVDESWPLHPAAQRSERRVHAEQQLRDWAAGCGSDLIILRVAGIYAADRLPLERIRQGAPVVKADQAPWSNRIHAEDLVEVCLAAAQRAPAGAIYNVCDGHPSTMTDYFLQVAEAAGLPPPPQIDLQEAPEHLSPGMLSYMRESRRLDNARLREELGIVWRYPDLSAGLAAVRANTAGAEQR